MKAFTILLILGTALLSGQAMAGEPQGLADKYPDAQAYLDCLNAEIGAHMYIDEQRRGKLKNPEAVLNKCKRLRVAAVSGDRAPSMERIFARIEESIRSRKHL